MADLVVIYKKKKEAQAQLEAQAVAEREAALERTRKFEQRAEQERMRLAKGEEQKFNDEASAHEAI